MWVYISGVLMKTTIELSDELLVAAKKHAAEHRTTLRALIETGLLRELAVARSVPVRSLEEVRAALEPLRGNVVHYDAPTEPLPEGDWEALG